MTRDARVVSHIPTKRLKQGRDELSARLGFVIPNDAEGFVAELTRNGAAITQSVSLSLREIFLQLVRKEQPCMPGNAGATPVSSSSPS